MACFLVPTAEAIVVSVLKKKIDDSEKKKVEVSGEEKVDKKVEKGVRKISFSKKLSWLSSMLWGGAILLALEHIWHGEVVFYPPFLTAMHSIKDTKVMLHEMGTVGIGMAVFVTAVWIVMVFIADRMPDSLKLKTGEVK
ncbi:MAG: hypothetical protein LBD41_05095 [Clostridiales Family XIII bacterium]|jgi:hypothetical protein|nr:hypothetical protein [Clostridiales Family XIII bacterium]